MLANDNNQFSRKPCRSRNSKQFLSLVVKRQSANGHEADAHPERNQIDNEIEIIELHGWINAPTLAAHPQAQLLAGIGTFLNQQPILFFEPIHARLYFLNFLQFRGEPCGDD